MILGIFTKQQFKKVVFDMLIDFSPIFLFAITYRMFDFLGPNSFFLATIVMMISTLISTFLAYQKEKRIPYFPMFVSALVLLFGFLTLLNRNPDFVKLKDTFQDAFIATGFLIALLFKYPIIKKMFGHLLPLSAKSYSVMTWNWVAHFYILAIANEYVRLNMTTGQWIMYKFVAMGVTITHGLILLYHFREEIKEGYRKKEYQAKDFEDVF